MNKTLRQLFTAVIVLFVILGISSSIIMVNRANRLSHDSRNTRALYQTYGAPRGSILASDGTIIAKSDPVNDSFSYQRSYPQGDIYAPITGYFSIAQNADRGIEASENELLTGESNALFWQHVKALFTGKENKGASIETSIDPKLQTAAMEALKNNDGAAVAIEPKTGRILAMASTPSYDPNELASHDTGSVSKAYTELVTNPSNPMLNRAISELYPPGSTFKTVVAAAALDSGKYQLDTQIPAGASYTLPGTQTQLTNAEEPGNGTDGKISLKDAMAWSSNTAFAQLGVALGDESVSNMAKKFGFDKPIVIDGTDSNGLPMQAVASRFPTNVGDDRLALASIGQGDTVETPLQNAMIAAAIANDGKVMKPTLVDRVRFSDLSVMPDTKPQVMDTAFSADTANKLTEAMEAVVTDANPNLEIPGVKVAAKTGTAQIGANNSSIDGWVMGFAPADDPKIAVAVVVHNVDLYGSFAAATDYDRDYEGGAPTMRLIEGQLIHCRYRLDSRLAQGGMGEVWKGYDIQLGRPVAIKALRKDTTNQESKLRRLRAEARNSANLAHPNIAALFEYYEHDGIGFLIMEYVPSKSLADLYHELDGPMDPIRLLPILIQTARGLFVAHSHGVIHRDVKPANIMVSDNGEVKITDFGVSYSTNQEQITQDGMVVGTAQYISPEQAQGQQATPQSDIYSLGVVAYEGLCGHRPFTGATPVDIAAAHVNNPVPPLPNTVDFQLSQFVMSMLAKDPADRPQDALTVARVLSRIERRLLDQQTALSDTTMVNINGRVPRRVTSAPHHDLQTYQSAFPFAQQTQRDAGTDSPGHAIAGGFGRSINE